MTLPVLGLCPTCRRERRMRNDGALYRHAGCPEARPKPLLTTFARWLWTRRTRRDAWTNPVTQIAQIAFGTPGGCGDRTPTDVAWTTADAFHAHTHTWRSATDACTWVCEQIELARAEYARLSGGAA